MSQPVRKRGKVDCVCHYGRSGVFATASDLVERRLEVSGGAVRRPHENPAFGRQLRIGWRLEREECLESLDGPLDAKEYSSPKKPGVLVEIVPF